MICGIDFGTSNSCITYYKNDKINTTINKEGENITASYIYYDEENNISIGKTIKNSNDIKNLIYLIKKIIGRDYNDIEVEYIKKIVGYEILNDGNNIPIIKINNTIKYIEEILKDYLYFLKKEIEEYNNQKFYECIITYPVYYTNRQIEAIKNGFKLAGFKIINSISESVAAIYAYGLNNSIKNIKENIMIIDLGAGTLDIAIIEKNEEIYEIITKIGDNNLGGNNIDDNILKYCISEFYKKNKIININELLQNKKCLNKLKKKCEEAKIILTYTHQTKIIIDSFYNDIDLDILLTKNKFDEVNTLFYKNYCNKINEALTNTNLLSNDISNIILIGGSTKIPKIREITQNIFLSTEIKYNLDPDLTVSIGASLYGFNQINQISNENNQIILIDTTALSIGIQIMSENYQIIIPKNSKIPAIKEYNFRSYIDYQQSIKLNIYEGERDNIKYNSLIGTIIIDNLPFKKAYEYKIKIIFEINKNNLLKIFANIINNDDTIITKKELIIEKRKLNDEYIEQKLLEYETNYEKDLLIKQTEEYKILLLTFLEKNKQEIINEENKEKLKEENIKINKLYYEISNEILITKEKYEEYLLLL